MFEATQTTATVTGRAPLRLLFLTGASLMVLTGSALAADLPVKAPPPAIAASLSSWAGFYLGVHAGYGWKTDDFSRSEADFFFGPASLNGVKSKGAVYGGHAGYNWQFGRAVTGLEIDLSATDIKGSNSVSEVFVGQALTTTSSDAVSERVRYLGSARARIGWLPTDNVLLYGTAGLAWERLDQTQTQSQVVAPNGQPVQSVSFSVSNPLDKFGWVAGVGAEVMLGSPNWIGRIEYLHYDLGQVMVANSFAATGGIPAINTAGAQTIDIVRAGISYKFGEPARLATAAYTKAPVAPYSSSWAGFYLGAHAGYGWGDDPGSQPAVVFFGLGNAAQGAIGGIKSTGWVAGGHFGHNWQYNRFVAGLEADLDGSDLKGSSNVVTGTIQGTTFTIGNADRVKYLGTLRGRLGWSPADNFLLYGTTGLAWERIEQDQLTTTTSAGGTSSQVFTTPADRFGWVAGVGGEMKLGGSNWIGRLEYLHYDFGRINVEAAIAAPTVAGSITAGRQTIDVVRAGISYKFDPVVTVAAAPTMYAKAPRLLPQQQSWAGFYIGAHGGYGWKSNDFSTNFANNDYIGGINSKGWLGGGQAGYNWQYGKAVAGLELDGSATGIQGSSRTITSGAGVGAVTETLSDNVKYLGTARGRLGWTPAGSWLLYGTGGLAWERANRSQVRTQDLGGGNTTRSTSDAPRDQFGWVAGAGVETFIASSNWIARLEYLHYDFGTVDSFGKTTSTDPAIAPINERGGRQTIDAVRAAVSYKFTP